MDIRKLWRLLPCKDHLGSCLIVLWVLERGEKNTHLSTYYSKAALCISSHFILSSDHERWHFLNPIS